MKLTEMRELLAKRDIQLTKSLGQNFLHDANQLERIANAAELTSADKVLEIGPGLGPLTELLLKKCGQVLAIELDGRLVDFLQERYTAQLADESDPQLELHHDDALKFLQREPRDWRDWKLVANLPYSVASPILVELSAGSRAPKMIVVTLQLEVAQRLMAPTDDDHYGILTLLGNWIFSRAAGSRFRRAVFSRHRKWIPRVSVSCVVRRHCLRRSSAIRSGAS